MLKAGDTLYIRGGTYTAPATGWNLTNSGTASQPITITNYPGERAILTADSSKSGNYIIKCLLVSPAVDYIRIIGSDVTTQPFDGVMSSKGIVLTGVRLGIAPAIAAYQCDNWEIAGIDFIKVAYGIFQRKVNNGNTSADRWYVHDNRVYEYYRESGMQFNGNANRIENNEIIKVSNDYSSTYGCQLLNLLGNNNVVRGNKLTRLSTTRCIGIFFEWDLADNNLIENNVITGVVNGLSFFGGDNNIIRNNQINGTDTAFVVRSWADGTTAYPCNFSEFMPLESNVASPDWQYMYPHDCRSKGNRFENNTVSGFSTFSTVNLPEPSNVFLNGAPSSTATATPVPPTPTATNPPTLTATNPPAVTVQTRMLIPLYTAPSNWGQVISANVGNVIDVVVNPNNGVGTVRQDSFANGIASLRSAGIGVFGYVATGYGTRNIDTVKTEIDTWQQWYAPSGIFLDEADNTNDSNKIAYYGELYNYIRAKGIMVIINPGAMTTEAYMSVTDAACIFETTPRSPIPYPAWGQAYPAKLCALAFSASRDQMIAFINEAKGRFGYVYATSDTPGNPWDNLPNYLAEEAALLAGLPVATITAPATSTTIPAITSTSTPEPAVTATFAPTETAVTATPIPQTPVDTPTFTPIPPTLPSGTSVLTIVEPDALFVGETGLVNVSLNGLPAEGVVGVEFTCSYASNLVSVSNVQIGQIFGADPVSAYNDSQDGSFILAVAGSNGKIINTDGVAFTFSVTGIQTGSSVVECKANISRGNNSLESITSVPDSLSVTLQSVPTVTATATALSAPMLAGQVIASKPVTISLYNPDATLAATANANPDGTFNLSAPAGTFTVVASAEGYLSAQGNVTLAEGATTTLAPITLPAGDIDNNAVIDQFDALTLGMNYNLSAALPADLSNDGLTNIVDLEMLAENYRMTGSLAWQQP